MLKELIIKVTKIKHGEGFPTLEGHSKHVSNFRPELMSLGRS